MAVGKVQECGYSFSMLLSVCYAHALKESCRPQNPNKVAVWKMLGTAVLLISPTDEAQ